MSKSKLCVVVFRNNLRIEDNYPLFNATKECENIICLYSREILQGTSFGFKNCGSFREEFLAQSLDDLKYKLLRKNIWLYIIEEISPVLKKLDERFDLRIFYDKEVGIYEKEFEKKLDKYTTKSFFNQTMIKEFEFDYTKSFSYFRKKAEAQEIIKPLDEVRRRKQLYMCVDIKEVELKLTNKNFIKGGEINAKKRVEYYLDKYMHDYLDTRSLVDGYDNSSMFSPYLAVGCISARTIYHKIKEYENKTYNSKSSYWIYFELLWRDFFHLVMLQSKNRLFLKTGILEKNYDFKNDKEALDKFFNAKTKVDIIDAGIIELKTTGWISNRMRQLLASYFVKNLGLDFRYCASFFEEYLLDYNPASNYGNFAYQAGVGNDKSYRVFDPVKQSLTYGGKSYVKKWLNKDEEIPLVDYKTLANNVKKEIFKIED